MIFVCIRLGFWTGLLFPRLQAPDHLGGKKIFFLRKCTTWISVSKMGYLSKSKHAFGIKDNTTQRWLNNLKELPQYCYRFCTKTTRILQKKNRQYYFCHFFHQKNKVECYIPAYVFWNTVVPWISTPLPQSIHFTTMDPMDIFSVTEQKCVYLKSRKIKSIGKSPKWDDNTYLVRIYCWLQFFFVIIQQFLN